MSEGLPIEILVVEDNPYDLEMTLRGFQLAQLGQRVQVARDGAEALDYLFCCGAHAQRHLADRPKVVLLDLKLPKVDGLEVLARIKADERTRSIPVVMMTSSQERSDVTESYRLGVNSYVVKPVQFDSFVQAVQDLAAYWVRLNA